MRPLTLAVSLSVLLVPAAASAQEMSREDIIRSAVRAGPSSISDEAGVWDWGMNEIRPGTNGWICLPDRPDTEGDDPWCMDGPWFNFLDAYVNQTEPSYSEIGFAYMLMGDTPVSNSDPYATEPTSDDDWVTHVGAHVMMLIPDRVYLEGMSTDHRNGGPWVMWPNTPYAHLMIPFAPR
ncbi:MAG: hypothetical protein WD995_05070 [Gemmatimonadota bacterium]